MNSRPHILALAVLAGSVSALAKGGPGYLAMIGPAPMRFAKRVDPVVAEPLPTPAPEKAVEPKEPAAKPVVEKPIEAAPPGAPGSEAAVDIAPPPPPPPVIPPIGSGSTDISPYQLLHYLLKPASTNAVQPVVVLPPINFAPPVQTVPPPSSTATYQKGP